MKGIIVTNGYYSSPQSEFQAKRMYGELTSLGCDVTVVKNNIPFGIGDKFEVDFAVFFDKDINFARNLEESGVLVFNSSFAIENTDDKIRTAMVLERNKDIVTPLTIPAPKRYFYDKPDENYLRQVGDALGYPLVVKQAQGSLGKQVYLAENYEQLVKIDKRIGSKAKLYQQYVVESKGKSVRVIVIGKKVFSAMLLTNEEDFRSNASVGGHGEEVILDDSFINVAEEVATLFDLDYCGVDFFAVAPIVIEINSNAYFETMEKVTGKNVALEYAKHIVKTTEEFIQCKNLQII